MKFTINSKKLDKPVEFSIPGNAYIYVDLNGYPGILGDQLCYGGHLMGDTMVYHGEDESVFKKICRAWFKSYLRLENN